MKHLFAIIILLFMIVRCGDDYNYVYKQIPKHDWKYSSGYNLGDYIPLSAIKISNDTIFTNDTAIAIIENLELREFDMVMYIASIHSRIKGRYVSK